MNSVGHRKFFLSLQFATPLPNFNFIIHNRKSAIARLKGLVHDCKSSAIYFWNRQPQIRNCIIFEVRTASPQLNKKIEKKKSKKSMQQTPRQKITIKKFCLPAAYLNAHKFF